jgi:hypothetical protein
MSIQAKETFALDLIEYFSTKRDFKNINFNKIWSDLSVEPEKIVEKEKNNKDRVDIFEVQIISNALLSRLHNDTNKLLNEIIEHI